MIKDQAYGLRKMMERKRREKELKRQSEEIKRVIDTNNKKEPVLKHIIAVTSGKGGVGKSTISANLSLYFSSRGMDTVLIDADLGLANLDLMLGVKSKYNLQNIISGERNIVESLEDGPFGVRLLAGASGISNLANIGEAEREHLLEEISLLQYETELLLIDTGAGLSDNVIRFLLISDTAVVVITDEPASMADGYGMIKSLVKRGYKGNILLIMNKFLNKEEGERLFRRIHHTCKEFLGLDIKLAGIVEDSNIIKQSSKTMRPLLVNLPESMESKNIKNIGSVILGESLYKKEKKDAFIKRLYKIFWNA